MPCLFIIYGFCFFSHFYILLHFCVHFPLCSQAFWNLPVQSNILAFTLEVTFTIRKINLPTILRAKFELLTKHQIRLQTLCGKTVSGMVESNIPFLNSNRAQEFRHGEGNSAAHLKASAMGSNQSSRRYRNRHTSQPMNAYSTASLTVCATSAYW